MVNRLVAVVAVLALASPAATQSADAGLTKGIAQVQDGRLDDAVTTLGDVVKRLSGRPIEFRVDLAQAHLWLGIAHAQLDSEKLARDSFREALTLDGRVRLAEGWPPKVSRLFAQVMSVEAVARAQEVTGVAATSPDTPPPYSDSFTPEENAVYVKYRYHADVYDFEDAEAVLRDWIARNPRSVRACSWLADFLFGWFWERAPRVDDGMAVVERCVALDDPKSPTWRHTFAYRFYEMASQHSLQEERRPVAERFVDLGLKSVDQALKINPNLIDSTFLKALLLQVKAGLAKTEKKNEEYMAEARRLRAAAVELGKSGKGALSGAPEPGRPPM